MLNDDGVQGLIAIVGAPIMLTIKDARIEGERGKIADERALKDNKFEPIKKIHASRNCERAACFFSKCSSSPHYTLWGRFVG